MSLCIFRKEYNMNVSSLLCLHVQWSYSACGLISRITNRVGFQQQLFCHHFSGTSAISFHDFTLHRTVWIWGLCCVCNRVWVCALQQVWEWDGNPPVCGGRHCRAEESHWWHQHEQDERRERDWSREGGAGLPKEEPWECEFTLHQD